MYDPGRRSALRIGDVLYLYEGGMLSCGPRRVTGRSAAHVDRLARDWIGHGVAPCLDGSRGVGDRTLDCCGRRDVWARSPHGVLHSSNWLHGVLHPSDCPHVRWKRAEARARRVVRRG